MRAHLCCKTAYAAVNRVLDNSKAPACCETAYTAENVTGKLKNDVFIRETAYAAVNSRCARAGTARFCETAYAAEILQESGDVRELTSKQPIRPVASKADVTRAPDPAKRPIRPGTKCLLSSSCPPTAKQPMRPRGQRFRVAREYIF